MALDALPEGLSLSACPSEYRPISVTLVLSKIFERLLPKQFGYCKGLGTCDALLSISAVLQCAFDESTEACTVDVDFYVAFHCVNHKHLQAKIIGNWWNFC